MQRQEMIAMTAIDFAEHKIQATVRQITDYYKGHRQEIEEEFLRAVVQGLQLCRENQKKLGYVTISILESSLITKSYDLQIAFYDKDLYVDRSPIQTYWASTFIYANLDADMEDIGDYLKHKIIRLKHYEIYELKQKYIVNLYYLISFMMKELALKIIDLPIYQETDKEATVKILFGKYMEKLMELCTWEVSK